MCDKSLNNKFLKFFESCWRLGCCERVERCVFRRRKAEDGYGTTVLSQVCVTKHQNSPYLSLCTFCRRVGKICCNMQCKGKLKVCERFKLYKHSCICWVKCWNCFNRSLITLLNVLSKKSTKFDPLRPDIHRTVIKGRGPGAGDFPWLLWTWPRLLL